ncbi:hypothetical protein [Lentzea sp. NEAU-D7]|uniref:hypothetical protein n=1 Tax=Lentzea sp. NEAU-D7 TaxID=2994667 RepID=UPI00224B700B|nr:hypothetical protein [Lentzea sp. NEAU-D7]MCX2947974.1 hypothetical protein [Lentzea sp. NEAU-D7]
MERWPADLLAEKFEDSCGFAVRIESNGSRRSTSSGRRSCRKCFRRPASSQERFRAASITADAPVQVAGGHLGDHVHSEGAAPHSHGPSAADRCRRADEFTSERGLGDRVCALGNGQFKVRTAHGDIVTHIDAPLAEDKGVRDSVESPAITTVAARSHHCAADSYRIQLVYLIPAGAPGASATMVPLIRQHFVQSNAMVSNRAAEYGGDLSLRVACDASGQPAVRVLRSGHDNSDIAAIDQEVARQGQRITGQDNVVYWRDGGCGGGVAYGSGDTRPGVENAVNNAPGIAVVYGRCPFTITGTATSTTTSTPTHRRGRSSRRTGTSRAARTEWCTAPTAVWRHGRPPDLARRNMPTGPSPGSCPGNGPVVNCQVWSAHHFRPVSPNVEIGS